MALINLTQQELFDISSKLALAYQGKFTAETVSRASTYTEGCKNTSRNYIWAILMNTKGKSGKTLSQVYNKKTAQSLCKLTLYKLSQPTAEVQTVDAF